MENSLVSRSVNGYDNVHTDYDSMPHFNESKSKYIQTKMALGWGKGSSIANNMQIWIIIKLVWVIGMFQVRLSDFD
jgi:hypothetical protein